MQEITKITSKLRGKYYLFARNYIVSKYNLHLLFRTFNIGKLSQLSKAKTIVHDYYWPFFFFIAVSLWMFPAAFIILMPTDGHRAHSEWLVYTRTTVNITNNYYLSIRSSTVMYVCMPVRVWYCNAMLCAGDIVCDMFYAFICNELKQNLCIHLSVCVRGKRRVIEMPCLRWCSVLCSGKMTRCRVEELCNVQPAVSFKMAN